ncbi:MAG: MurR/RpiR family transcriptional regulator [Streptococcaceae bacterium]|jgi:DNA-binding MurR/RpiR family transcriptional regulator|nr:MurR/RpiR family transcriptional regulator [Streptococcaceae bacterium]
MAFLGKTNFQELSETEKVIYGYLRDNFEKIPYIHMRDIALSSHAGTSSVMRLIRKLGYQSYYDFQEFVGQQIKKTAMSGDTYQLLSVDNYPAELMDRCNHLVDKIIDSKNILFFGLGASGYMCEYAARRFSTQGVHASPLTDTTYPFQSKLPPDQKNLIIVLSISGETMEIAELLQSVKDNKLAAIASITPKENSSIALLSELSINYDVQEKRVHLHADMTSQLPALFIIETLSELLEKNIALVQ